MCLISVLYFMVSLRLSPFHPFLFRIGFSGGIFFILVVFVLFRLNARLVGAL